MIAHLGREVRRQLRESGPTGVIALLLVAVATTWGGVLWAVRGWVTRELLDQDRPATVVATLRSPADSAALESALASQPIRVTVTVSSCRGSSRRTRSSARDRGDSLARGICHGG